MLKYQKNRLDTLFYELENLIPPSVLREQQLKEIIIHQILEDLAVLKGKHNNEGLTDREYFNEIKVLINRLDNIKSMQKLLADEEF